MQNAAVASRGCRVLVVEDDSGDLFLFERALQAASIEAGVTIELMHCENGLAGLSSIAMGDLTQQLPDIVVVDLNMPIMRGDLFLRRLRVDLELPGLPAVVLTTTNERLARAAAKSAGANHVFTKPAEFSALVAIADKVIDVATNGPRALVGRTAPKATRRVAKRRLHKLA